MAVTPILRVTDLTVEYETPQGRLTAVSNVSFDVGEDSFFGLVGESGCGKSTLAKALLGVLDENGRVTNGTIEYKGNEIQDYSQAELNEELRWTEISLIPQASMNSLDPLLRMKNQAAMIAKAHGSMDAKETEERLRELFEVMGLQEERVNDYPHQFSGGMKQRAIIAFSLILDPSLIIADEPTTALDVIMQDQVLKYLEKIQEEEGISIIIISHDIAVVFETCDEVGVMHSGQLAEVGASDTIYESPRHPYSILLQQAFPDIRNPNQQLDTIDGYPPENLGSIDYCTFVDRCPWAMEECEAEAPELDQTDGPPGHRVGCHRWKEVQADVQ